MACRKCLSVNRVRSYLPVTSRSEYDTHTPARVDVGPLKENYSSIQWSNTVITQLSEAYCNVLFLFMHTWVCMSLFMYVHVSATHTEARRVYRIFWRWLWVLGIELRTSVRTILVLKQWATSSAPGKHMHIFVPVAFPWLQLFSHDRHLMRNCLFPILTDVVQRLNSTLLLSFLLYIFKCVTWYSWYMDM